MVLSYRVNAALLRAMRMFVQSRANTPFYKKATKLETRLLNMWSGYSWPTAKKSGTLIREPQFHLGVMMVSSTLFDWVVMPHEVGEWKSFLPKDDQALKRELTRAFLSYLGVEQKKSG